MSHRGKNLAWNTGSSQFSSILALIFQQRFLKSSPVSLSLQPKAAQRSIPGRPVRSDGAAEAAPLRGESSGPRGASAEAGGGRAAQTEDGRAAVQARVRQQARQASLPIDRGVQRCLHGPSSVKLSGTASRIILNKYWARSQISICHFFKTKETKENSQNLFKFHVQAEEMSYMLHVNCTY